MKFFLQIPFYLLFFVLFANQSTAQSELLSPEELEKAAWFYDLDEALEHPEKVYNLSLTWMKLKEFPEGIFKLTNLQHLDLMDNEIRSISPEIAKLKNLQILFLSNNKLEALPEDIKGMEHLEVLHLERNRFESLPTWIAEMKKLNKVGLRENKISEEAIKALNEKYKNIEITK